MKIAYDGTAFHGQARQPGLRTVEGEVIHALQRARVIRDPRAARFQSASRTDRGVSALGNVVAFDAALAADAAVRAFNGKAQGVWGWSATSVPPDFNARRAVARWYRYVLPPTHSADGLNSILRLFEGELDFRNFTKDRSRTRARIDMARASREANRVIVDFRGPSFRWNLVRRLVAAAIQGEKGSASVSEIQAALGARGRVDFGLAPAEPLLLMDVEYDFPLQRVNDPTAISRVRRLLEERTRAVEFLELLRPRVEGV